MLYRLAFRVTRDNFLHVCMLPKDLFPLSTLHVDDQAFAKVLFTAKVPEPACKELLEAARTAWRYPGLYVYCKQVTLSDLQLETLRLVSAEPKLKVN